MCGSIAKSGLMALGCLPLLRRLCHTGLLPITLKVAEITSYTNQKPQSKFIDHSSMFINNSISVVSRQMASILLSHIIDYIYPMDAKQQCMPIDL